MTPRVARVARIRARIKGRVLRQLELADGPLTPEDVWAELPELGLSTVRAALRELHRDGLIRPDLAPSGEIGGYVVGGPLGFEGEQLELELEVTHDP